MLISVAIIVKNEEKIIERCIGCVSLFADEIVVVDTGSSDKTKELAGKHQNVRLYESEHFNKETHFSDFSFSVAKNEAIEKCKGKWVIWWDADDFVTEESASKIRSLAEQSDEVCLYSFNIKYGPLTFKHCRMFRNGHDIKFDETHSVHEYLNTLGHPDIIKEDIEIMHIPGDKDVPSGERNIAIMEKDYHERGMKDQRTCFYLANSYREANNFVKAIEFYREYLTKSSWNEERYFARYYMTQCLIRMEEFEEAKKEALLACAEDFRFAEAFCILGDLAYREEDYERAQAWFTLAANTPFPNAKLFLMEALYGAYPNSRIKDCHDRLLGMAPKNDESKKIECVVDVRELLGTFELPEEPEEAALAVGVLSAIASSVEKAYEVVTNGRPDLEKAVKDADGLMVASGKNDAFSLILPPNLNGRPRAEWYGRAAGFVPSGGWSPIVEKANEVAENARRALNVH